MGASMKFRVAHLILIALTLILLECALCYNFERGKDSSVNQRLDHQGDKEKVNQRLDHQEDKEKVNQRLDHREDKEEVNQRLDHQKDKEEVNQRLDDQEDIEEVNQRLNHQDDKEKVNQRLDHQEDKEEVNQRFDHQEDKEEVNQRFDHQEDKEEVLTNEMDKVNSVISYEISKEDQDESAQQPGVTVLEVRREEEGAMIRFTVKYVSREETVEARWAGVVGGYKDFSGINTSVGNGVYETSVLFPRPVPGEGSSELRGYQINPDWVGIYLDLPDETFFMMLNVTTEKAVDREIPSLRLEVEPAGDFVYHEGEEFSFKIRIPLSVKENESQLYLTATHLDPRTGEVTFTPDDSFIDIDGTRQFPNYHEVPARIKGTENGASGVIIPSLWFHNLKGVVSSVQRARAVVLRPSTEEVPFPEGFLAFVVDPNYGGSAGEEVICRLGEDCYYICRAAGSDITDITMTWIKADGTYQTLDSTLERSKTPYLKNKAVYFHVDYVPEETEKIRCVVETTYGKLISKEATLVVSTPVNIIAEESGIVLINGAEDATRSRFEVSCTVTGSPRPNVIFNVLPYDFGNYEPADNVIERGNNKYTMTKTFTIITELVNNRYFFLKVMCKAMPTQPYYPNTFYGLIYDPNGLLTVKLPVSSRFDSDQLCCISCRRLHSMENFID